MTLSVSITALIADEQGHMSRDFMECSQRRWVEDHMLRRYNATPPLNTDAPEHPARRCAQHLEGEYTSLRRWFDAEGKLSPLLMSRHLSQCFSGPAGDGIGWDFLPGGDPDVRMLQFKGTLINCRRIMELKGRSEKLDCGSGELGGIARLVRSAYQSRAEGHLWKPAGDQAAEVIAKRWVSYRTFVFLLHVGAEPDWAWGTSRCRENFGVADCQASLVG
jgi:hypothetical protein